MLATSVRVRPCSALCCASSDGRFTTTDPSSSARAMSSCSERLISPLGPFTVILCPSICAVTPAGSATGFLPIRDIWRSLPDDREHFAAHAGGAGFAVRHEALRRAENRHAEAVLDARNLARLHVAAQSQLAQRPAAPAAAQAAVVAAHLELRAPLHPLQPRLLRHEVS